MATTEQEYTGLSKDAERRLLAKFEEEDDIDPFVNVNRTFRGVIYGEPGCGKTVLAARIGALYATGTDKKALILDVEGSTESLVDHREHLEGRIKVRNFPGIRELTYLLPLWVNSGKYCAVVVDSFTSMIDAEMKWVLQNAGFNHGSEAGAKELYAQQDYGLTLNRLTWLLEVAGRAKIPLIMTGHVYEPTEKEILKGQKRRLHGSKNQAVETTSRVGNVFYAEDMLVNGERAYLVRTRTDGNVMAKTRIQSLPDHLSGEKLILRLDSWRQGIEYKG